jgi:hypothetical protein
VAQKLRGVVYHNHGNLSTWLRKPEGLWYNGKRAFGFPMIASLEAKMEKWIPWDQLAPPAALWAAPEDTVAAVRLRLGELEGHARYNAPILIRLPQGRIAPTAAAMLRKLAKEEGASILERRLGDLVAALCPEPWTVESQGPDDQQAADVANHRQLPVIALQQAQPAALLVPSGRQSLLVVVGKEDFDLFDEPLPRPAPSTVEFLQTTPDTTVAQVARDLKILRHPQSAFIIVEASDGSFEVLSTAALNEEAQKLGGDTWGLPLHRFAAQLQPAARREYRAVGQKQARAIADRAGFLVLLQDGTPTGLLISQIVYRDAQPQPPVTAEGPSYDLFDIPQEMLHDLLTKTQPETRSRSANLWFTDASGRLVPQDTPLVRDQAYHLEVNIGRPRQESIIQGEAPAIAEPPQESAEGTWLYVSLFWDAHEFDVDEPTQRLLLPPSGDSLPAQFQVTPRRRTFGPEDRATLDLHIYYRCNLVQSWQVQVEVGREGQPAQGDSPQVARLLTARTTDYMTVEEIGPRHLSLTIDRAPNGDYYFDIVVRAGAGAGEQGDEVRLPCRITLRREDLAHLITKARRQLYNIARSPDYLLNVAGSPTAYRQSMRALATIGRQLYHKLFRPRDRESSAAAVERWIQEGSLKPDSTIQIVDRAGDFVFPWALVYDGKPWKERDIDPHVFWGVRYQIEVLSEPLAKRLGEGKPVIDTKQLSLGVGLYDHLRGARQQRSFFRRLSGAAGAQVKMDLFNNVDRLQQLLQDPDQHLLYFFCHGFTERMAADIQLGDDLVAGFQAWHKSLPREQQADIDEAMSHADALFDVSDSWLQLTNGTAPLTMMEDTLLDAKAQFRNGPLVFLNMCESAQVLPSLSDGFIPFFIAHGARGVIGTECPMTATFADPFAREFFRRFFAGQPVGKILLDLRRELLIMEPDEDGNPSGNPLALAYTLYCDADLRLAEGIPLPGAG